MPSAQYVDLGSTSDDASQDDEDLERLRQAFMGVEQAAERLRHETHAQTRLPEQANVNDSRHADRHHDPSRTIVTPHEPQRTSSSSHRSSASTSSKWYNVRGPKGQFLKQVSSDLPSGDQSPRRESSSAPTSAKWHDVRGPNGRFLKRFSSDLSSSDQLPSREASSTPAAVGPGGADGSIVSGSLLFSSLNVIDSLHSSDQSAQNILPPKTVAPTGNTAPTPDTPYKIGATAATTVKTGGSQSYVKSFREQLFSVLCESPSSEIKVPKKKGRPRKHPLPPLDLESRTVNLGAITQESLPASTPTLLPAPAKPSQQIPTADREHKNIVVSERSSPGAMGTKRKRLKHGARGHDSSDDSVWAPHHARTVDVDRERAARARARPRRGAAEPETSLHAAGDGSPPPVHHPAPTNSRDLSRLLRERELGCMDELGDRRIRYGLQAGLIERYQPWRYLEGASKDIIVAAWSPNGRNYAVSTSTELDDSSRPYNKEKNFLWGDIQSNSLHELDAHYVKKARSETLGDRAGEASSQATSTIVDDRLFTTVSSICFSPNGKRMFSGSYDHCVKAWSASPKRKAAKYLQTLPHEGRVELLGVSQDSRLLATAQNTAFKAISIYDVTRQAAPKQQDSALRPQSYPLSIFRRSTSAPAPPETGVVKPLQQFSRERETKSLLYPSALQWGVGFRVNHLLVAGFAENKQDSEERDREGDLCIWHAERGQPFVRLTPSSQNVFDVAWHPVLPVFAAATTPGGQRSSRRGPGSVIKTFCPLEGNGRVYEFDCPALDINEVKFNPTDPNYVSAACTNGNIYVWDRRNPDQVLQVLKHGPSIEPLDEERTREEADTGVRFMDWNPSGNLLYTGSSDGVVKSWNPLLAADETHVGNVASFDSAVMSGAFSPDRSHLLIGLCKGAVHVLSSAPWSANPGDDSDAADEAGHGPEPVGRAQEIKYWPASSTGRRNLLKRGRNASQSPGEERKRKPSFPTKKSMKVRARPNTKNVNRASENSDGATTEDDSDIEYQRGVSEVELLDYSEAGRSNSLGAEDSDSSNGVSLIKPPPERRAVMNKRTSTSIIGKAEKGRVPSTSPAYATRVPSMTPSSSVVSATASSTTKAPRMTMPIRRSASAQLEPPSTSATPRSSGSPAKSSQTRQSLTPKELREDIQKRRAVFDVTMWREPPKPPTPRAHLQKKRSAVQKEAVRAARQGNIVELDDD